MTQKTRKPRPQPSQPRKNTNWIYWGLGFAVVAIALIAVVLSGVGGDSATAEAAELDAEVEVTGALPPFSGPADQDPAAGMEAPTVIGNDFDGTRVAIEDNGMPKLVIFLAHWCPHCQAEVPRVQAWLDANQIPEGVEFLSIATSIDRFRDNFPSQEWLDREGWTLPVIVDDADNTAYLAYGAPAFPGFAVIDQDFNIVLRASGEGALNLDGVAAQLAAMAAN